MRLFNLDIRLGSFGSSLATRSGYDVASSDMKDPMDWVLRSLYGMATSATGITVTPLKALGVATLFGCVRVLSDTISTIPLEVHQRVGRSRRVAREHPLFTALNLRPNSEMSSVDWRASVQANLLMLSNGYSEILRDSDGTAVGTYPIETNRIDPRRKTVPGGKPQTGPMIYHVMDSGVTLEAKDVLHLRSNTFNGLRGINTTVAVREVIALALALQDNAAKFFGNGSRPGGVLEHPMSLSTDAQKRLEERFEEQTSGKNLYRLMVLEEGMKYNATRSENKDSQFIEAKDAQNLEICRIFGVPPHKVGIMSGQPRANIEEENIGFVTDVIRPHCIRWEQEMDIKLFTDEERARGFCTSFDLDALLRGNRKARLDAMAVGRQWGIYTSNDCRSEEQLPEMEGGDVLLQPTNMIDAAKATEYLMKNNAQPSSAESGFGGKPQKS